jgi:regulator of protease activity HflC (stomatin/prohibitin superfamily)
LRAESFSVDRVRVHDKHGAPVELAAVVVWRIIETARASFDVNCVTDFVRNQCESAVKHLAGNGRESIDLTPRGLRGSVGELQEKLQGELQSRVTRAGVVIDEVRLTQRCENWAANHIHSDIEV